jgi:hypothetical protein
MRRCKAEVEAVLEAIFSVVLKLLLDKEVFLEK